MTWVKETSLAQDAPAEAGGTDAQNGTETQEAFLDMVHAALASGVPVDIVQTGLKQIDLTADSNMQEQFAAFVQSNVRAALSKENCQPI